MGLGTHNDKGQGRLPALAIDTRASAAAGRDRQRWAAGGRARGGDTRTHSTHNNFNMSLLIYQSFRTTRPMRNYAQIKLRFVCQNVNGVIIFLTFAFVRKRVALRMEDRPAAADGGYHADVSAHLTGENRAVVKTFRCREPLLAPGGWLRFMSFVCIVILLDTFFFNSPLRVLEATPCMLAQRRPRVASDC
ncbi:hypothetical protein EVAR_33014_1 [Eumeta japonica]|uniref:Uncharacterized protein n=1 Tax=Eumeta variegata TaxID=151549 RepID=A0A4C1VSH6_EUMVA|nr:hypothetical protein EVAR_33014_1 [Eumeta japonica]